MPGWPPSEQTVHDGNWLAAAVKLGWVGPVVTIGVEAPDDPTNPPGILECGRINTRLFRKDAPWMERRHRAHHKSDRVATLGRCVGSLTRRATCISRWISMRLPKAATMERA